MFHISNVFGINLLAVFRHLESWYFLEHIPKLTIERIIVILNLPILFWKQGYSYCLF